MNKNKNSKTMLILSILLLFIVIGTATAADDKLANETVSTSTNDNGVDTLTIDNSGVDKSISMDSNIDANKDDSNQILQLSNTSTDTISINDNGIKKNNEQNSVNVLSAENIGSNTILNANEIGTFKELSELINNTQNGIIKLDKDYTFNQQTDQDFVNGIPINITGLSINGLTHTINGNGMAKIFNIIASNVILKDIKFINGYSSIQFAPVYVTGSNVQVIRCEFQNNTATNNGGALTICGVSGFVDNCKFINNTGLSYHGALYIAKGGDNSKVQNSLFENNHANDIGALSVDNVHDVIVSNCIFNNNTAANNMGAVNLGSAASYCTISSCIFKNNKAKSIGALNAEASKSIIESCKFDNNTATTIGAVKVLRGDVNTNIDIYNSVFTNNHANSVGALQFATFGGQVTNCTFINNTATTSIGALYVLTYNGLGVFNSYFYNNSAASYGAVDIYNDKTLVDNCTFIKNSATNTGGAGRIVANVINSVFKYNTATNAGALTVNNVKIMKNCTFEGNTAQDKGGALYSTNQKYTISDCVFNENNASSGGAIYTTGNYFVVKNSKFSKNNASIGGAIYTTGNYFAEVNCQFQNNNALKNTAAMYIKEGNTVGIDFNDSKYVNSTNLNYMPLVLTVNSTNDTDGNENEITWKYAVDHIANGGTIYINSGIYNTTNKLSKNQLSIIGLGEVIFDFKDIKTFSGNFISLSQGLSTVQNIIFKNLNIKRVNRNAIVCLGSYSNITNCKFINNTYDSVVYNERNVLCYNCEFENNNGISVYIIYKDESVINCTFKNNNNTSIYMLTGQIKVIDCNFINNTATTAALYIPEYDCLVSGCNFTDNKNILDGQGGAIYMPMDGLVVENSYFRNNSASNGGAIYYTAPRTVTISNSTFIKNNATNGGAVYTTTQSVNINGTSYFENNMATEDGGAIYSKGLYLNIDDSTFIGNNATNGGAIYTSGAETSISNSQFKQNNASKEGGAIYNGGKDTTITGTTFEENNAVNGSSINLATNSSLSIDKTTFDNSSGAVNVNENASITIDKSTTNINDSDISGDGEKILSKSIIYATTNPDAVADGTINHPMSFDNALNSVSPNGEIRLMKGEYSISNNVDLKSSLIGWENDVIFYSPHFSVSLGDIILKNITFSDVDDEFIVFTKSNCEIDSCNITGAASGQNNKLITVEGSTFKIINTTISGCNYSNIIYTSVDEVTIDNCIFDLNKNYHSNDYLIDIRGSDAKIQNTNFTNNKAKLINYGISTNNLIDNCIFVNNTDTSGVGGFILINSVDASVLNCEFENNTGVSVIVANSSVNIHFNKFNNNSGLSGSALSMIGGSVSVDGNNFTKNKASGNGGAVYLEDGEILSFDNNNFFDNSASNGGAIYSNIALIMNNINFKGNKATNHGGAIYLNSTGNVLSNIQFTDNSAPDGGAIYLTSKNSLSLNTASFKDNSHISADSGNRGTIYLEDEAVFGATDFDFPEGQDIYNGTYYVTVIYVSMDGGNRNLGLTSSSPIRLDQAWSHFKPEFANKIIFTDDGVYTLYKELSNYNLTIVGNNATITNNDKKSLFNNRLTHIKSCS